METRNTFLHDCAKNIFASMLTRHSQMNTQMNTVVLDYPIIEQWTGGFSDINLGLQIPSYFYETTSLGVYKCPRFETLKLANLDISDSDNFDTDNQGPMCWKQFGHKHLTPPLFTADIYAYGGKHNRSFEIWMIDGDNIVNEDMINELISWHHTHSDKNYSDIQLNCISSKFILSQDKKINPAMFMKLCRNNAVQKIPGYTPDVITPPKYSGDGTRLYDFFNRVKSSNS